MLGKLRFAYPLHLILTFLTVQMFIQAWQISIMFCRPKRLVGNPHGSCAAGTCECSPCVLYFILGANPTGLLHSRPNLDMVVFTFLYLFEKRPSVGATTISPSSWAICLSIPFEASTCSSHTGRNFHCHIFRPLQRMSWRNWTTVTLTQLSMLWNL